MLYNYEQNYNVLERFEHNDYQNILMGVEKDNPDEVVVINLFKKSVMIHEGLADLFRKHLSSLVMLEETEDELIVITKYHEGMPLKNYLENYDTTLKHRLNFAYEFLKKVSIYNDFNYFFMNLFIDEEQIIMKDDELYLNELLVIDRPDEMATATFQEVCQKVGNILDNIISAAEEESAKASILEFIHTLKSDNHEYTSLDDIHDAFKKIYLYDLFLDEDENFEPTSTLPSENFVENEQDEEETDDWESNLKSAFGRSSDDRSLMEEEEPSDYDHEVIEEPEFEETPSLEKFEEEETEPISSISFDKIVQEEVEEKDAVEEQEEPVVIPEEEHIEHVFDNGKEMESIEILDDQEEDEILSDEEEEQLQALFAKKSEPAEKTGEKKKRSGLFMILGAAVILLLAIFGINACQDKIVKSQEKPIAHIVKTRIGDSYYFENKSEYPGDTIASETEWKLLYEGELQEMSSSNDYSVTLDKDGKYLVELRVKNNQNVWSEIEQHEFYHVSITSENGTDSENIIKTEKLDNYTIRFEDKNITKDESIYRNGSYSIKIDFDADDTEDTTTDSTNEDSSLNKTVGTFARNKTDEKRMQSKSFTIVDTFLDDKAIISLWLRSSDTDPISITFIGYNNKSIVFTKELEHSPSVANQWEMQQFSVEVDKLVDSIEVIIKDDAGQVWIDDFAINSYK